MGVLHSLGTGMHAAGAVLFVDVPPVGIPKGGIPNARLLWHHGSMAINGKTVVIALLCLAEVVCMCYVSALPCSRMYGNLPTSYFACWNHSTMEYWTDVEPFYVGVKFLALGILVILGFLIDYDDPVLRYMSRHPKAFLRTYEISLVTGLVLALMFAAFSQNWRPFLATAAMGIFIFPPYKKWYFWAINQKFPVGHFLCVFLSALMFLATVNLALHTVNWESLIAVSVPLPAVSQLLVVAFIANLLDLNSPMLKRLSDPMLERIILGFNYRLLVLRVSRDASEIDVFVDNPFLPGYPRRESAQNSDFYSLDGRVVTVVVERRFRLRPFRYPGQLRLVWTRQSEAEKLRQILLEYLPRFGKNPVAYQPLDGLVQALLEVNPTRL